MDMDHGRYQKTNDTDPQLQPVCCSKEHLFSVLIFLLWTFLCFNWDFNAYASVWLFYPFTVQQNIVRALC